MIAIVVIVPLSINLQTVESFDNNAETLPQFLFYCFYKVTQDVPKRVLF